MSPGLTGSAGERRKSGVFDAGMGRHATPEVFRRAHQDAPDPVALSKKMMSSKIRNVGSVLLLEGLDTIQNFRIEIHQPEPEDIFLFLNGFLELQLFCLALKLLFRKGGA